MARDTRRKICERLWPHDDRNGAITKQRRFKGLFAGFVYRVTAPLLPFALSSPQRVRNK